VFAVGLACAGWILAQAEEDDAKARNVLVTGVDAQGLAERLSLNITGQAVVSAGSLFDLRAADPVGRLLLGVFASAGGAEPSYAQDMWGNSIPLFAGLDDHGGEVGVGDAWEQNPREGWVCFRRANVLCAWGFRAKTDDESRLAMARRVDDILVADAAIAPRGDAVKVPRIEAVLLDPPKFGARVRVRFDVVEGPPVLWWNGARMSDGPVTSGVVELKCDTLGERTGTFWLVTEMNVVANTRYSFTVPEPAGEGPK
jgi:hypothetical protein